MKLNKYFFSYFMCLKLNKLLFSSNFLWILKASDILPTNKKKGKSDIENYRPINIPPTLSKMYSEIYEYFDQIFSKY